MKKPAILVVAILSLAIAMWPAPAAGQSETTVSAGTAGVFPSGTAFNGVPLNGLTFGIGVTIASTGPASGNFQTTLLGKTSLGAPQEIKVDGTASSGSLVKAGTSANFSGTCSVDMGDGTPLSVGVPFTAKVVTNTKNQGTLTLVLGTTNLPAGTVTKGSMTVK